MFEGIIWFMKLFMLNPLQDIYIPNDTLKSTTSL